MMEPIKSVLVLGGGTAGLLAALAIKRQRPALGVRVLRSSEIGTIMVGEGTTDSVPAFLHAYLGIDQARFHREVDPTWKLGIRFRWGARPEFNYTFSRQVSGHYQALTRPNGFYCGDVLEFTDVSSALMHFDRAFERLPDGRPAIGRNVAYHMENHRLVDFLERYGTEQGIAIEDDTVAQVDQDETGITALRLNSGRVARADLYIDASGFRSVLLRQALGEPLVDFKSSLLCDRAIAGGWARTDEPILPYTTSETMEAGWSWRIEHRHQINRGYVYSSAFLSDEAAEREFRAKNPKVGATRVVKFLSGRTRNLWVKNAVAIGNAAGFVEPLQSSSLAVICELCAGIVRVLNEGGGRVTSDQVRRFNSFGEFLWESVRRFLAINYKFNTRLETPFWRTARETVDLSGAEDVVEYYRANGPATGWAPYVVSLLDPFGLEGYWTMLLGQGVEHAAAYQPSPSEWQIWNRLRAELYGRAQAAMTIEEALNAVHDPAWIWPPDFYTMLPRWM
jgi:tryptophan halogenase